MSTPSQQANWKNIYFVGIGGIGMSAIARYFHVNRYNVAGYDKTPTVLTETLQKEGIPITFSDAVEDVPPAFIANQDDTLIVYTPAIPAAHRQLEYFRENGFEVQKRSQVLGWLTSKVNTIAVAGTHGKTTTSSMVAHILKHAEVNCAAFLGGITQNYGTNFLINRPTENPDEVLCVVEADEFDRSFLTLFPKFGIVTSTDADHLDIYGEHDALLESFRRFVSQIHRDGALFLRKGLTIGEATEAKVYTYALTEADYHAANLRVEGARFCFDLVTPDSVVEGIQLRLPGFHNVENAIAASAAALAAGVSAAQLVSGLNSYLGVKRRFEYVREQSPVIIDDYAHHPTEINAFLSGIRALYPGKHVTAIFQPHLFTRTRDFLAGFVESLGQADRLILMEIYPARELPIEGINSTLLLDKINLVDKQLWTQQEILEKIGGLETEVIVTIGAGDIDKLVAPLARVFE